MRRWYYEADKIVGPTEHKIRKKLLMRVGFEPTPFRTSEQMLTENHLKLCHGISFWLVKHRVISTYGALDRSAISPSRDITRNLETSYSIELEVS